MNNVSANSGVSVRLLSKDTPLRKELQASLEERSIQVQWQKAENLIIANPPAVTGHLLTNLPTIADAILIGESIASSLIHGLPPVFYLTPSQEEKKTKILLRASILAYWRSHGAVVTSNPSTWLECMVLLSNYGLPPGPTLAIIAPQDTWLWAASISLEQNALPKVHAQPASNKQENMLGRADQVLADVHSLQHESPTHKFILPVSGRTQIFNNKPMLKGLAESIAAAEACGQASQRIEAGSGAATEQLQKNVDFDRFDNQLSKLNTQAGDHETKVLLSSYEIAITRQAVATTPSAASRIAKKAGYPVQMKAWGEQQPSEQNGALLLKDITTASQVRRAFSTICQDSACEAVIVRETPMSGREVQLTFQTQGALGLVAILGQAGLSTYAAALAPVRPIDAIRMARQIVSSRSKDLNPDWQELSVLIQRASHLVADNERILSLSLSKVIVAAKNEGIVVVDASAILLPR